MDLTFSVLKTSTRWFFAIVLSGTTIIVSCSKDDVPPVITLTGGTSVTHVLNTTWAELGYSADDEEDGDVTSKVTTTETEVNTDLVGTYTITYSVSDAAGNIGTTTRDVNVKNESAKYDGTYLADDHDNSVGTNGDGTYIETISASKTKNNEIFFQKFAFFSNAIIMAKVTGQTFTISPQTIPNSNGDNLTRIFSGNGTISGTTFTCYYHVTNGNGTGAFDGSCVYTKQ